MRKNSQAQSPFPHLISHRPPVPTSDRGQSTSKTCRPLIAPDVVNQQMKQSADGANSWTNMPDLTRLVTNNGDFLFDMPGNGKGLFPFVSAR